MYQNMLEFVKGLYVPWNWTGRLMVGVTSHKGVGSPGNLNWASTLCEEFTAGRRVRKGDIEGSKNRQCHHQPKANLQIAAALVLYNLAKD